VNNVAAPQGDASAVPTALGDPVAGDAAKGATVAGDAGVVVVGDAAEGDVFPADPDKDVDEDADQVVVNSCPTWFLASNTYHYGNFDLLWIQIDGDRHNNAPAQYEDGIELSTYPSLRCHVFARQPFNLGLEEDGPVDDLVWIRQDHLHGLSVFLGINHPIFHQQPLMMLQKLVHLLDKACPCSNNTVCLLHTIEPVPTPHRPVLDWSHIHVNGGAPAIGSQLIYQPSYYNEWEAPMWIFPTMPRAPPTHPCAGGWGEPEE
jgi:hypothetical protein